MKAYDMLKYILRKNLSPGLYRQIQELYRSVLQLGGLAHLRLVRTDRIHDRVEDEYLRELFRHLGVDAVIDVGANTGQYAKKLRKNGFLGKIFSFEPNPGAYRVLEKNASNDKNWHIFECALGDKEEELTFNVMENDVFSSLMKPRTTEDNLISTESIVPQIPVPVRVLSDVFRELQRKHEMKSTFLKLDTQGYDKVTLEGGKEVLPRIIGIQSELSIRRIYAESPNYLEMIGFLENLGFSLAMLVPNNQGHFPRMYEIDGVFLRN